MQQDWYVHDSYLVNVKWETTTSLLRHTFRPIGVEVGAFGRPAMASTVPSRHSNLYVCDAET